MQKKSVQILYYLSLILVTLPIFAKKGNIEVSERERINSNIRYAVNVTNKQTPTMVSKELQHTSSIALDLEIRHIYTYIHYKHSDFVLTKKILNEKHEAIINTVCTSKGLQVFIKNKVKLSFYYYGREGKLLYTFNVNNTDCT